MAGNSLLEGIVCRGRKSPIDQWEWELDHHFLSLFAALPYPSLLVTQDQVNILQANDAALLLYGRTRKELLQLRYTDLLAAQVKTPAIPGGKPSLQYHCKQDGSIIPVEVSTSRLRLYEQPVAIYSVRNLSQQVRLEEKLRKRRDRFKFLAYHDPLTGLPNRLLFQDRLEHALAIAQRMANQLALLYIDVDRFKAINDSFGHETGDRILCEIARTLRAGLRATDTLARMSGDEFVVILEQIEDPGQVLRVVRKIQGSLAEGFLVDGQKISVSVSIGVSLFPDHATEHRSLIRKADLALLQAKESGRNSYRFGTELSPPPFETLPMT